MKVKVLKRMTSLGNELNPGDIVDASGWRHTKALVSNRYIEILSNEAPAKPAPAPKVEAPKVQVVIEDEPKKAKKVKDKE
jgi:hypothetical protein